MKREIGRGEGLRRIFGTVLRLIGCVLVAWAFTAGSYTFPTTLFAAIGLATLLNILVFYEFSIRDIDQTYTFGTMMAVVALVLGGYGAGWLMQPPVPTGPLQPAGDPSPASLCPEKAGPHDLAIYFATDRIIGRGAGPFTPFVVDHCPSLALQPKNGGLLVQAVAYDYGDNVAFTVRNNVYEPAELLQLRVLRPDKSTFILLDRFDQEVIYVRYLNRSAVLVRARFLCGEAPQALIRNNGIFTGGVRIQGAYVGLKRAPGHRCAVVQSGGRGIEIGDPS